MLSSALLAHDRLSKNGAAFPATAILSSKSTVTVRTARGIVKSIRRRPEVNLLSPCCSQQGLEFLDARRVLLLYGELAVTVGALVSVPSRL